MMWTAPIWGDGCSLKFVTYSIAMILAFIKRCGLQ
jgi:hypothetical protein